MIILDTESNAYLEFQYSAYGNLCAIPEFFDLKTYPPPYYEKSNYYLGYFQKVGYGLRETGVFKYSDGKYIFDLISTMDLFKKRYYESILNSDEITLLNQQDIDQIKNNTIALKLVDFLYYSKRTNHIEESKELLKNIHNSYTEIGLKYMSEIDPYKSE